MFYAVFDIDGNNISAPLIFDGFDLAVRWCDDNNIPLGAVDIREAE